MFTVNQNQPASGQAPMPPERLDAIRAREGAATKGPWCTDGAEIYQGDEYLPGLSEWIGETCRADEGDGGKADAAFVAAARSDVPALLAEVDRLRTENATIEAKTREAIAQDFIRQGKASDSLSWGQAVSIARDGLCACSGGIKPCDMGGAA